MKLGKQKCNNKISIFAQRAKFFIIDEISMNGKGKLHDMHTKLGYNMGDNGDDHIFGNRSFIFAGDFQQLPPIGDVCLLSNSRPTDKNLFGHIVFQKITHYFELTDQKRQDDDEYLKVLRNIRNSTVTEDDYNFLKKHCTLNIQFDSPSKMDIAYLIDTKIIVSQNMKRVLWNRNLARKYAVYHEKPLHICNAIDEMHHTLNLQIKEDLKTKLLKHLQPTLHLVIGMPIVILQNLYKYLRVNNGSEGILRNVIYNTNDRIIALQIEIIGGNFHIPSLPANQIYVTRETISGMVDFGNDIYQMRRSQFPVSEGFCLTDYKVQGATLPKAIVDLKGSKGVSAYVKLSRTKNRATTRILDGFTKDDLIIKVPDGYKVSNFLLTLINN